MAFRNGGAPFRFGRAALIAHLVVLMLSPVSVAQIETASFPVVQLDESARVAALGGRSPALKSDDVAVLFSNPALLSSSRPNTISFSYLNHIGSLNAGWITYGRKVDSLTTAAIGLRYLGYGSFDRANELGERSGTFGASDMSLSVGASRKGLPGLSYGASINVLLSSIDGYHASALVLDVGATYEIGESGSVIGASAQNAGFVMSSFGRRRDRVPFDIRIGFSKKLAHMPLLLSVSAYRLNRIDGGMEGTPAISNALYHLVFGGEFQFSDSFQIRFGYNHRRHDELQLKSRLDLAGFSVGTGIQLSRIALDYAFNSWSSLGGLHRFSIRTGL